MKTIEKTVFFSLNHVAISNSVFFFKTSHEPQATMQFQSLGHEFSTLAMSQNHLRNFFLITVFHSKSMKPRSTPNPSALSKLGKQSSFTGRVHKQRKVRITKVHYLRGRLPEQKIDTNITMLYIYLYFIVFYSLTYRSLGSWNAWTRSSILCIP